jgi:hypothetical protein
MKSKPTLGFSFSMLLFSYLGAYAPHEYPLSKHLQLLGLSYLCPIRSHSRIEVSPILLKKNPRNSKKVIFT